MARTHARRSRYTSSQLSRASRHPIELPVPAHNAAVARSVLAGEPGPVRETAVLNAAAALVVEAGTPDTPSLPQALADACTRAASAIDSGAAAAVLDRWIQASQRLAAGS
jgi:anthranilate phosphoribosyltransferase